MASPESSLLDSVPTSPIAPGVRDLPINQDRINEFLASPATPDELRLERGFLAPEVVDGYLPLGISLEHTAHAPVVTEAQAKKLGKPHLALSGRIASRGVDTGKTIDGAAESQRTISVVDSNWVQGHVWADAEAKNAEERREFSVLDALRYGYAFAVFEQDDQVPHPLTGLYTVGGEDLYAGKGDWKLRDVVSSEDANPANGHFQRIHSWLDGQTGELSDSPRRGDIPVHQIGMLSDVGEIYEGRLKQQFGRGYKAEIDKLMEAFYMTYVVGEPPKISVTTHRLMEQYKLHSASIFDWRIPARGHARALELKAWEKDFREKHGRRIPSSEQDRLKAIRDHNRKEVIQALAMNKLSYELGQLATIMSRPGEPPKADPVRWRMRGLDDFDVTFASRTLPRAIERSPSARERGFLPMARKIADIHGKLDQAGAQLIIEAGPGNSIFMNDGTKTLKGPMHYYDGKNGVSHSETAGGTPADIRVSAYDTLRQDRRVKANLMAGVVCYFSAKPSDHEQAQRFMVVDLLRAPSAILRRVVDTGYFEGSTQDLSETPYLSDILATPPKREKIYLTTTTPQGDTEVVMEMGEGQAAIVTYDEKQGRFGVHGTTTAPYKKVARMDRADRRRYGDLHVVKTPKDIPEKAQQVTSVAMKKGAVHIQDGPGFDSDVRRSRPA